MRLVMNEPVERMDRPYARRWWALLVLCLSLLIIVMAKVGNSQGCLCTATH